MSDEQTSKALRELGVESVNKDKLGIRVSALREAGITDMDKLCSMTYKQLSRLKGIGEESAYLIYTVAGRIKNEIAEEIRVRINPEEKDELSTRLLKSLSMQMDEISYVKEAQALIDSYAASINVALSEARGSVGIFKRLISSGKKKKPASI